MDKDIYEKIKKKYGKHASWAIWPLEDLLDYEKIKRKIKPNIVIVALNAPSQIKKNFKNFHHSPGNDEKLKCAFEGTKLAGAYMTDVIRFNTINKSIQNLTDSRAVMKYLEENPKVKLKNIKRFKKELETINKKKPKIIIALGKATYKILSEYFKDNIIEIEHHSSRGHNKCAYKENVRNKIRSKCPSLKL
jgi:hypothetical protein